MAPKRRASPLDEPPAVSSSEEEENSSEEESLSEDDDGPSKPPKSIAQKPQPASKSVLSSSESETDSDSGSDTEDDPPTVAADPVVKSTPKAKKTKSQLRSAKKRSNENNQAVSDSERAKKGKEVAGGDETPASKKDGKKALEEPKKLFQRLWSEDDEIAILEGMTTFLANIGPDPYKEISSFHDFIKKSLHTDVSNEQLLNKIRKMKQKYKKIATKITTNGAYPRLTKPHDIKSFELSKKIWGTEGENGGTEVIKGSNTGPSSKPKKARRQILTDDNVGSSLILSEMIGFNKNLGVSWLDEDAIRREVELIGPSKRAELEDMWKKLQVAELELFVKRADLIRDHATLIWEAYKSSK